MDPHKNVENLVTGLNLEQEGGEGQQEKQACDSSVKDINGNQATWQSLLPLGEESLQFKSDEHTKLRGESSDLKKTCDENEEIAEEGHETTFYSLDTQADETCMDAAGDRHWTEVRETKFLDSHDYQPPTCLLDPSKVRTRKKIAEGGQGTVYAAHYLGDEEKFKRVLKVFKVAPGTSPQGQWPDDVIFSNSLFVCILQGFILQSDGSYALLMDRYDGDLCTFIDEQMQSNNHNGQKPFDVVGSLYLIVGIAMGMKALHTHGITHRDMKTANVLIKFDKRPNFIINVYIGDFESSCDVVGTCFWRSPEVLQALKERKREMVSTIYTPKSDIYSFGMTCYEILTGKIPLDEYPPSQYNVVLCEKKRPELPEDLHPKLRDFISRCWHQDPDGRPTSTKIVVELKQLVEALDIPSGIMLLVLFGYDEGFNVGTFTLEADLSELQELLQANETSLTVEGFACGCEFVSLINKFLQKFGFDITHDNKLTDAEMIELFDLTKEKLELLVDYLGNVTWVGNGARNYAIHLCGRVWGQWLKFLYESVNEGGALETLSDTLSPKCHKRILKNMGLYRMTIFENLYRKVKSKFGKSNRMNLTLKMK